jgi:hypothetical protein
MKPIKLLLIALFLLTTGCPGKSTPKPEDDSLKKNTYLGLDFLGLGSPHWPCDQSIATFPKGWALGLLDNTFGDPTACLEKFLKSGKVGAVRVHLINGPCHRNKRCEAHDKASPTDFNEIAKRTKKYVAIFDRYKKVRCYISPVLEHDIKDPIDARRALETVKINAPNCGVVNSTVSGARFNDAWIIDERHGENPDVRNNGIISTDGDDIVNMDVPVYLAKYKTVKINYFWAPRYNLLQACKQNNKPVFIPPTKRKALPSTEYLEGVIRLAKKEKCPAPIFQATPIIKPSLYKPYAEDSGCSGGNPPRNNKPLFIGPNKGQDVRIITAKNQELGKFTYYGPYDRSHRYYSGNGGGIGLYGYQIGDRAKAVSGSSCIWLRDSKGKNWSVGDPAHREGFYK